MNYLRLQEVAVHKADRKLVHRQGALRVHHRLLALLLGTTDGRLPAISIGLHVATGHCKALGELLKDANLTPHLFFLASLAVGSLGCCAEAEVHFHIQRANLVQVLCVLQQLLQH